MINETFESLKTDLKMTIDRIDDPAKLYKVDFYVHIDDVIKESADFFKTRDFPTDGKSFDLFVHQIIGNLSGPVQDRMKVIYDFKTSKIFDTDKFLEDAKKAPVNIADYVDDRLRNGEIINKLVGHVADDWSNSAVGKGEYALGLLLRDGRKTSHGSDIFAAGKGIEIKGNQAKLSSQTTHASPVSIRAGLQDKLKEYALKGKPDLKLVSFKQLREYYDNLFTKKSEYVDFLKTVFTRLLVHSKEGDFDYLEEVVSKDCKIDIPKWTHYQSCYEYDYYMKHEGHDALLFIDPDKNRFLLTETVDDVKANFQHFTHSASYNFWYEMGKSMMWQLKPKKEPKKK